MVLLLQQARAMRPGHRIYLAMPCQLAKYARPFMARIASIARKSYKRRRGRRRQPKQLHTSLLERRLLLLCLAAAIGLVVLLFWPEEPAGAYSVVGRPSISAAFINRVLAAYHSPAAGKGQALYDDGLAYNIDPVYALAFFLEESRLGTQGVARVTHSLGNIRASPGDANYEGYRRYASWEEGFADWYRLIADDYVAHGLSTIDQIVPVYAPASDGNDEAAYIRTVKLAVNTWRSGVLLV
jgi:hypothetical protein